MCARDVMVTRGGSYTHEAAGHAAMVSTEIKSKEEEIIFSVSSCPQNVVSLQQRPDLISWS